MIILQVKGRSDLFLKLEVIKKIILLIIILISFFYGFTALLIGYVLASIIALFINTYYAGSMIDYTLKRQILDILPIFYLSIFMGLIVFFINYNLLEYNNILRISISSAFGIMIYLFLAYIFKFQSIFDIKNLIKK